MKKIYSLVEGFPEEIVKAYKVRVPKIKKIFNRVIIVGMGGSYIAGLTFKNLFEEKLKMPIDVVHSCNLVDGRALYILISYSGNTKEIVDIFKKLKKLRGLRKTHILILTAGGELLKKAEKYKTKLIKLPEGLHQRFTFPYCFFPLIRVFEKSKLLKGKNFVKKIVSTLEKNKKKVEEEAILLALKLKNENPLFYASEYFYPVAYRLQTAIEEDAKILAHSNKITELFHNEIEALPASYFLPVLIIDGKEARLFKRQIKFFKEHIKDFYEIGYKKYSEEERIFLTFYFADFLGYHLARLRNKDVGETPISDKIKKL